MEISWKFVLGYHLFLKARSFSLALPLVNCSLLGTDYIYGRINPCLFGRQMESYPYTKFSENYVCTDTQRTFHYDSNLWINKDTLNLEGGKSGFDLQETKLPTYWNTPFTKICLGMKIDGHIRYVAIARQAKSLYSLIADGEYRATSLGRDTWKWLIGSKVSLQPNCNKEGFNVKQTSENRGNLIWPKARIGILGNGQNSCATCDSRIGFGSGGHGDDNNTCGNEAARNNGDTHIKAMGYILVQ